ncbi:hypothetical protein LCGC14_0761400 [marine sediment metagenome]|uniref:Uncharacterized protein n=1 Tax=marine sediment metagenome TaxID=412755 RepID=A0A0F9Q556_9ZZZZ
MNMYILFTWLIGFGIVCLVIFCALGARYGAFEKIKGPYSYFDDFELVLRCLAIGLVWPLTIPCITMIWLGEWFRQRTRENIPTARTVKKAD